MKVLQGILFFVFRFALAEKCCYLSWLKYVSDNRHENLIYVYASLYVYSDYSITSRMYFNIIVSIYAD